MSLKNILRKLIATFGVVTLIFGNFSLCGVGLSQVIAENLNTPEITIEIKNNRYVKYDEENFKGIAVNSNLSLYPNHSNDTYIPTESVNLTVSLPAINGCLPERAIVAEAKTKSTTGEELNTSINQNYDSTSGLLTMYYQNITGYEQYVENTKDEFEIIYIYPKAANIESEEKVNLSYSVTAEVKFKTENGNITSKDTQNFDIEEMSKGKLTSFRITDLKEKIYKGFLYSNVQNKTNYETEYKTTSTLTILNASMLNQLELELKDNNFLLNDEEETQISSNGNIIYKSTEISKYEFDKMLGANGHIEFYDSEGIYATVKYLEIEEDNKLVVEYENGHTTILENGASTIIVEHLEDLTNLKIKTSKPTTEGFIHFENTNIIKASEDYDCDVKTIKSIETLGTVNGLKEITELLLSEPETRISVDSSNLKFSTLQNNSTTLTINLDNTKIDTKLFDNPIITIELPEGLVKGNISTPRILNGNGLEITEDATLDKENNVINIPLSGKHTSYDLNNVSGGTSIVLDLENLDFEDTIPTHEDKIKVVCTQGEEITETSCDIQIVSKEGLLVYSKLSGYNAKKELVSIDETEQKDILSIGESEKVITLKSVILNNYNTKLSDICITGNIPFKGDEKQSNINSSFERAIQVSGATATVYYSKENDSWSEQFSKDAKEYKIVINKELDKAEKIEFDYQIKIPANLTYNQKAVNSYSVNYNLEGVNKSDISILTLETQNISDINVEITPNTNLGYVTEGQLVELSIKVQNNSKVNLENVKLEYVLPEEVVCASQENDKQDSILSGDGTEIDENIKNKVWNIEKVVSGEIVDKKVLVKIKNIENDKSIKNIIKVKTQDDIVLVNKEVELAVKKALVSINFATEYNNKGLYLENDIITYCAEITNITQNKLKNIKITNTLPDGLEYIEGYTLSEGNFKELTEEDGDYSDNKDKNASYNENERLISYNLGNLEAGKTKSIILKIKVNPIENSFNRSFVNRLQVNIDNDFIQESRELISYVKDDANIEVSLKCKEENIEFKAEDTITYIIELTNTTEENAVVSLIDVLPEELIAQKVWIEGITDVMYLSDSEYETSVEVGSLEKVNVYLECLVKEISAKLEKKEISNKVTITYEDITKESNVVTSIIINEDYIENNIGSNTNDNNNNNQEDTNRPEEDNNEGNNVPDNKEENGSTNKPIIDGNNQNNEQPKTYYISGTAWLDDNKNGKREAEEKLMSDITVSLVNKTTGNFALDAEGNKITSNTNSNGEYKFENIAEGEYIVLFEFDAKTYTVTTFQKNEIEKTINSDVISTTVTINNVKKLAGITDTIKLNKNIENIDIGLIENPKFDLMLDKHITKITVINSQGTEETTYEDGTDTAKVDLVAKYINTANVIVTYKFTITNNGDVTGYVDSLVDDLPSGLEFSSELNKDWYKGSDEKLYLTTLSGIAIKPGEKFEVELVLTKDMTEESTGLFSNNASLEKISNLEGIEEKEELKENNQSSADLFISIKTGSAILYIGITTICLLILLAGAYIIKKKVLNRGI